MALASPMGNSIDVSTYSNIEVASTSKLELDLTVDFARRILHGVATHTISFSNRPTSVWFDSVGLDIHGVEYADTGTTHWKEATYDVSTPNVQLGQAIEVKLDDFLNPYAMDMLIRFIYTTNN